MLLKVGFNEEVGLDAVLYWNKKSGNLAELINTVDFMNTEERLWYGRKAKERIGEAYSWQFICARYAEEFLK